MDSRVSGIATHIMVVGCKRVPKVNLDEILPSHGVIRCFAAPRSDHDKLFCCITIISRLFSRFLCLIIIIINWYARMFKTSSVFCSHFSQILQSSTIVPRNIRVRRNDGQTERCFPPCCKSGWAEAGCLVRETCHGFS